MDGLSEFSWNCFTMVPAISRSFALMTPPGFTSLVIFASSFTSSVITNSRSLVASISLPISDSCCSLLFDLLRPTNLSWFNKSAQSTVLRWVA